MNLRLLLLPPKPISQYPNRLSSHWIGWGKIVRLLLLLLCSSCGPKAPTTFVEGHYSLVGPGIWFAGESYELRDGQFTCYGFSDVGNQIPPEIGRYKMAGTTLHLTFENPKYPPLTLHWRWIDGVSILLNDGAFKILELENRLVQDSAVPTEAVYYIFCPASHDNGAGQFGSWESILKQHPKFARLTKKPPPSR